MSAQTQSVQASTSNPLTAVVTNLYRLIGYVGLASIFASLLWIFRYSATADPLNYAWNSALYAIFMVPHLIMTRAWFKNAVWGNPAGHPAERRVYILVTVAMWFAVLALHKPLPGFALETHPWVTFIGVCLFLLCVLLFFQGVTFQMIDGLLGVPGSVSAYSHGPQTPLFAEGPYASVRHPMYRAAVLAGITSLIIHPNAAQLFWIALIGGTFILFIPIEEAQMIRARGDDYRAYQSKTRWRLFRGIW